MQRLMGGGLGANDELDAPWSALCLAVLVQRSNDKSASKLVVRNVRQRTLARSPDLVGRSE